MLFVLQSLYVYIDVIFVYSMTICNRYRMLTTATVNKPLTIMESMNIPQLQISQRFFTVLERKKKNRREFHFL